MKLTPSQARFIVAAIDTAYDVACLFELFEDEYDREAMEDVMDRLRVLAAKDRNGVKT